MSEPTEAGTDNDPSFIEAEQAQPVGGEPRLSRTDRARSAAYRSRFALIYLSLALVAGVGGGVFVVLVTRTDPGPPPAWSAWRPTGSETAEVRQIADRVSKQYRLGSGEQLVVALVSTHKVSGAEGDVPVSTIAIRPDASTGKKEESDIAVIPTTKSLQFVLCGLGANCSITGGDASEARHALLRREALELALYTFKYVADVDAVSVFLPPRPDGETGATSVFLEKKDVARELSMPLARSIGATPTVGTMPEWEFELVDRITSPRLYSFEYQQAQDGSAVLVYSPVIVGA